MDEHPFQLECLRSNKDAQALRFCLRALFRRDPQRLRTFMGPDPRSMFDGAPCSGFYDGDAECGFERRVSDPTDPGAYEKDGWPSWAEYRVEVDDMHGLDNPIAYYDRATFEGFVKQGLIEYAKTFPEKRAEIAQLSHDLELGALE